MINNISSVIKKVIEHHNNIGNYMTDGYQKPSPDTCHPKLKLIANRTNIPDFFRVYAGIPANLLFNLIGFLSLVILFGILRKKAWNYGRLALLRKSNHKWMQLFYGDGSLTDDIEGVETSGNMQLSQIDHGFFSWIITAFKITDKELLRRAGPDGLLYISFQRHLIILTCVMTAISLCVALPINYSGNMRDGNDTFSLTTMSNVDPMSSWMWIYTIISLSYLPIGCYVIRKFLKQVCQAKLSEKLVARTLLISEIPKDQCDIRNLIIFFRNAFPTLTIENITLAYDVKRLSTLQAQRECAKQARLYCENYNKTHPALKIYPHFCGQIIGCFFNKVDALDFYTAEEERLTALAEEEKRAAVNRPLGIVFVTLGTPCGAAIMRRQLRYSAPTDKWIVNYAPAPSDIFWENLSIPRRCWYFSAISVNLILFIILFFLTTPAVIVSELNLHGIPDIPKMMNFSPVIGVFLLTILLVSVAALMPALVARSESLVRHWTRSGLNRAVMTKTLLLLLLMVLILPSLGLTSAQAVLDWKTFETSTSRWECFFLADQGAIFVNYVITAALLGSALELVRFPELAMYVIRLCIARSRAERVYVRKAVLWEFPLGAHYAWLLLVFTMTTVYSLPCPLITPFGVLYMLVKHSVDRHNLCFAYGPSVGGGQLASAAAGATGAAPVVAQATLLALGLARRGMSPLAAFQLSGLTASILCLVTGVTLPQLRSEKRNFLTKQNFALSMFRKKYKSHIGEETLLLGKNAWDYGSFSRLHNIDSNLEMTSSIDNTSLNQSIEYIEKFANINAHFS
ncbi:hypothetical protein PV326_002385 [Microctonus aethiopoides]|nr:hypothetical protein PV326_002385 [Microctonus aethiopoides]